MTKSTRLVKGRRVDINEVNKVVRDILHDCVRGDPLDVFADKYPVADAEDWEDAIVMYGNPWDVTRYAMHVTGADVERLQDAVHQRGNALDVYSFSANVKGANIQKALDLLHGIRDAVNEYGTENRVDSFITKLNEKLQSQPKKKSGVKPI